VTCPNDPNVFVIINTYVDDGGAILTGRSKYEETFRALSNRYPGTLDSSHMDRYLQLRHRRYDRLYVPLSPRSPGQLLYLVPSRAEHALYDGPL
jgi:hypothetical protein